TDKASVPVPSPVDGKVAELRIKAGDKIPVGGVIAVIATSAAGESTPSPAPSAKPKEKEKAEAAADSQPTSVTTVAPPARLPSDPENGVSTPPVPAGPATRRLARELGVSLHDVAGSARGGRVTIDDVKNHVRKKMTQPAPATAAGAFALP